MKNWEKLEKWQETHQGEQVTNTVMGELFGEDLRGQDFSYCEFNNVEWVGLDFTGCNFLHGEIRGVMRKCNFTKCFFANPETDGDSHYFYECEMSECDFSGSKLYGNLYGCKLRECNFSKCSWSAACDNSEFSQCDFTGCRIWQSVFRGSSFIECDLTWQIAEDFTIR